MKYPASLFVAVMIAALVIGSIADAVLKGTGIITFIGVLAAVVIVEEHLYNAKRKKDSITVARNVLAEAEKQSLEATKFLGSLKGGQE